MNNTDKTTEELLSEAENLETPKGLTEKEVEALKLQVQNEYRKAYLHISPKLDDWYKRLKLYNNQKKDPKSFGDPLLFTVMQTVVASLYDDKLSIEFTGKEDGDTEVADNLSKLAENDHKEMKKDMLDYFWIWDAAFFGKGYVRMQEFDRDTLTPVPELWDPLTFLRDPNAQMINPLIKGIRPSRYCGRPVEMTKLDIKQFPSAINTDLLTNKRSLKDSILKDAEEQRNEAQNRQSDESEESKDNELFEILEWYTYFKGKRVLVMFGNGIDLLVRYKVLDEDYFPIIERSLYPISHDFNNTSIPDLVEDKQRARAIAINLGIDITKASLMPMYLYNPLRIRNRADLNFGFNKYIPVEGAGPLEQSAIPLNKANPNINLLDYILRTLDESAQKATATPDIQQGMLSSKDRTLGELNLVANRADTRFSLGAKVLGWSELVFWTYWYKLYKKHFSNEADEKIVRIVGAWGTKVRPLTRENIVAKHEDPDITITSKVLKEALRNKELANYERFLTLLMKTKGANLTFGMRHYGKLCNIDKDDLERLLPLNEDEIQADRENELLSENKTSEVSPSDDHRVHLDIHRYAADTPATRAHMLTHKDSIRLKKVKPEVFPEGQDEQQIGGMIDEGQGQRGQQVDTTSIDQLLAAKNVNNNNPNIR